MSSTSTSVSNVASSRVQSGITSVPNLISLDVDNGFSKENRVTCVYFLVHAHVFHSLFTGRPRVPHPSILKTLPESVASSNPSKAEKLGTSSHLKSLPAANLVLPRSKTKRI